jgi:peptide/nickel transport system ATP-binding protein
LLAVHALTKHYRLGRTVLRALDGITLDIARGETLGLVGESGSGKSTFGRCLVGLHPPSSGQIVFDGRPVSGPPDLAFRRQVQFVFQDPYGALNPAMTIGATLSEHLRAQRYLGDIRARCFDVLHQTGLGTIYARRYPHEMSGGERQRAVIARAISAGPIFVVADEPVSALDVSTRAQIINLMRALQQSLGLTYLFISHDLGVVAHLCGRVAVMYLGRIVELAPREALFRASLHPYTQALLQAVPIPDPAVQRARVAQAPQGEPPDATAPPTGCAFHPRCPRASELCRVQAPDLQASDLQKQDDHLVACHHPG